MNVTIRKPDDFHLHLRDGAMLEAVTKHSSRHFARALIMPNVPAVEDVLAAEIYWQLIMASATKDFTPLMTLKLTERTTPGMIRDAGMSDFVIAGKLYPSGVTTASHDGISNVEKLAPVLEAMQEARLVLCVHAEAPGVFVLDREKGYLEKIDWIVRRFPGLKVVIEHITTKDAVDFVKAASGNVVATITAHHLCLTLDDVIGDGIRPHNFCYPVPKREDDLYWLRNSAAFNTSGKFFFGSDSAPHLRTNKESACGCAGVFSAPVALAVLAEFFFLQHKDRKQRSTVESKEALELFTSINGAQFYGLPLNKEQITLSNDDACWTVPDEIDGVVPFKAGEQLQWRVLDTQELRCQPSNQPGPKPLPRRSRS